MSRIKIAHITTIDNALCFLLLNQLTSLQQGGYEVTGVSSPGPHIAEVEAAGIRHIPITMSRNFSPLADLVSLWQLYRMMRRERFTIVHTHNPKPGLLGQLAARMAGVPVVVNTVHGFYFHNNMHPAKRRFYMTIEKIAARCSDLIISVNREDIETALKEKICRPEQIKSLGTGIGIDLSVFDPARFSVATIEQRRQELGIPAGAPVVGFVGRLAAKRKGFLDFLAAGKIIAERVPEVRFLIVGESDPGKPDSVEPSVAADYGIAERCIFTGRQPNDALPLLYATMNVFVLPSLFEGVPKVVMEASAMAIPAVVTDVKGNREAVENGRNGVLVPLGDVQALTAAILDLLLDPEKARRMGAEGRQVALERFDERRVFEKVKAEYARLLQAKGLPAPEARSLPAEGIVS